MSPPKLSTLTVTLEVSPKTLSKLRSTFSKVNYHPTGEVPKAALHESEVWFSKWSGIPDGVKVEDVPELKIVQLTSGEWASAMWRGYPEGRSWVCASWDGGGVAHAGAGCGEKEAEESDAVMKVWAGRC